MLEELKIVQSMLTNLGTQGTEAFKWWLLAEKVLPYLVGLIITTVIIGVGVWFMRRVDVVNTDMRDKLQKEVQWEQSLRRQRDDEVKEYLRRNEILEDQRTKQNEEYRSLSQQVGCLLDLLCRTDEKIDKGLSYGRYKNKLDGAIEILKNRAEKT